MEHTLLSKDNEVCLAWLEDALQQLRPEGHTKAVGYLEAVLEEVVFEMKMAPRSCFTRWKTFRGWEEGACSGSW
jgi:hypothetical protein